MDFPPKYPIMDDTWENEMAGITVVLGSFSASSKQEEPHDEDLVSWAARWNSDVVAQVVNPYHVESSAVGTKVIAARPSGAHHPTNK